MGAKHSFARYVMSASARLAVMASACWRTRPWPRGRQRDSAFPSVVGHSASGSWEIVSVTPAEGGLAVARDAAGNALGVLSSFGKGRTAVLGFGPEQNKHFTRRELAPAMMDNLLKWLLEEKLKSDQRHRQAWSRSLCPHGACVGGPSRRPAAGRPGHTAVRLAPVCECQCAGYQAWS